MSQPKLQIDEPLFIHGEACEITGIDSMTLNNWIQRKVIDFGTMHRSKRRLYSILDLVKLRVMSDLNASLDMKPSFAWAISQNVEKRAAEVASAMHKKHAGETQFLLAYTDMATQLFTTGLVRASELPGRLGGKSYPTIVVPIDRITREVTTASSLVLEREKQDR